jgi:hypothetical protein
VLHPEFLVTAVPFAIARLLGRMRQSNTSARIVVASAAHSRGAADLGRLFIVLERDPEQ